MARIAIYFLRSSHSVFDNLPLPVILYHKVCAHHKGVLDKLFVFAYL